MYSNIQILANIKNGKIDTAIKYLKANILESSVKAAKGSSKAKVVKNILNRSIKATDISAPILKATIFGEKSFFFTDGIMVLFTNNLYGTTPYLENEGLKDIETIIPWGDVTNECKLDPVDLEHFYKFYGLLNSKLCLKEITKNDMVYVLYKQGQPYSVVNIYELKDAIDYNKGKELIVYQGNPKSPILILNKKSQKYDYSDGTTMICCLRTNPHQIIASQNHLYN